MDPWFCFTLTPQPLSLYQIIDHVSVSYLQLHLQLRYFALSLTSSGQI